MATPLSPGIWMADMNPDTTEDIATDLDLSLVLFSDGNSLFDPSAVEYQPALIVTDLNDDLPKPEISATTFSGGKYLRAPEPPAVAMVLAALVFLGIFEMFRRSRRQKTHNRRRRVRIDLRMMS